MPSIWTSEINDRHGLIEQAGDEQRHKDGERKAPEEQHKSYSYSHRAMVRTGESAV